MGENAELLSRIGDEKLTVVDWLIRHNISFDENDSTENLIELYRKVECGEYGY